MPQTVFMGLVVQATFGTYLPETNEVVEPKAMEAKLPRLDKEQWDKLFEAMVEHRDGKTPAATTE